MAQSEYFVSRRTRAAQMGFCAVFVIGGVWKAATDNEMGTRIAGLGVALLFITCAVFVFLQWLHPSPRMILDDFGLYDRQLGTPVIPWKNILAAKTAPFFGSIFLMLLLEDESERVGRTSLVHRFGKFSNRIFGLSPFTLNPNGLEVPANEVLCEIRKRLAEHGLSSDHLSKPE